MSEQLPESWIYRMDLQLTKEEGLEIIKYAGLLEPIPESISEQLMEKCSLDK